MGRGVEAPTWVGSGASPTAGSPTHLATFCSQSGDNKKTSFFFEGPNLHLHLDETDLLLLLLSGQDGDPVFAGKHSLADVRGIFPPGLSKGGNEVYNCSGSRCSRREWVDGSRSSAAALTRTTVVGDNMATEGVRG